MGILGGTRRSYTSPYRSNSNSSHKKEKEREYTPPPPPSETEALSFSKYVQSKIDEYTGKFTLAKTKEIVNSEISFTFLGMKFHKKGYKDRLQKLLVQMDDADSYMRSCSYSYCMYYYFGELSLRQTQKDLIGKIQSIEDDINASSDYIKNFIR